MTIIKRNRSRVLGVMLIEFAALGIAGCGRMNDAGNTDKSKASNPVAARLAFRDSVETPPPGTTGTFRLSVDYPEKLPAPCADCGWLNAKVNFQPGFPAQPSPDAWQGGGWAAYIQSILSYVRQGQDPNLRDEVGFRTQVNGATRWYNVPWMAYDPTVGREYRHGTTNERTAHLQDLVGANGTTLRGTTASLGATHFLPKMTEGCRARFPNGFETWSVGYYNPFGGYALGKSIPKDGLPRAADAMGVSMPAGLPFPQGTAVMKVLTTNAPVDCVPYLKGSPEWQVNRHVLDPASKKYMCRRAVQVSRIVQIDVAVADARSPTGWVYGTFAYNGDQRGATFWDRLMPLGVQWGADPWTFPAVPKSDSLPLQQSVSNPGVGIFEHMGCQGRLAGPVDNPQSSCMSCHGSAYAARIGAKSAMGVNVPPSFGFDGLCTAYSFDNAAYFQNAPAPQSYPGGKYAHAMPLDTSLQLEVALQQYGQFATDGKPQACADPAS